MAKIENMSIAAARPPQNIFHPAFNFMERAKQRDRVQITLHGAIVAASESPRIVAAHRALTGELLLFLLQLQPHVEPARLAADHAALIPALERDGPEALREHLRAAAETLGATAG